MKILRSSLVARLFLWFALLSLLPLLVVMIFVRQGVAKSLYGQALTGLGEQAKLLAGVAATLPDENTLRQYLRQNSPETSLIFAVSAQGVILAASPGAPRQEYLYDFFSSDTVFELLQSDSGSLMDVQTRHLVGFSRVPGRDWLLIVYQDLTDLNLILFQVTLNATLQVLSSLFIMSLAGGVMMWLTFGSPLRILTQAALDLGKGQLQTPIPVQELDESFAEIGNALEQARQHTQGLLAGLNVQVEELGRAYNSLAATEQRFRVLFDSANDAIILHDAENGAILDVNKKFSELYGYTPQEASKLRIAELSLGKHPYNQRAALRWLRRARSEGPQMVEWRAKDRAGRLFWADVSLRAVEIGGEVRILTAIRDVDERKRTEQLQIASGRISQSAQSSLTMFEFFTVVHGIVDGILPAWNFSVAIYDQERNLYTYPYHFDEHQPWPSLHGADDGIISQVIRAAQPATFYTGKAPTGQSFYGLAAPLLSSRGAIGAITIRNYVSQDPFQPQDAETFSVLVTQTALAYERRRADDALRESEARWRALVQNTPQLILTINRGGDILFLNRTMPGFPLQPNQSILPHLPGEDADQKREKLQSVFRERQTISFEIPFSLPQEAEPHWLSCFVSPVIDSGRVDLAIFNAIDVTELKNAERQVRLLNDDLEKRVVERTIQLELANRELEAFSYSISHDLRAPLRAIDGFGRILADSLPRAETEASSLRYLQIIRENAQQMGKLIDDLLAFSRLGRSSLNKSEVKHQELIQQALNTLAPEQEGRQIHLDVQDPLPNSIGDPNLLKQVWVNLLSNALKFTRSQPQAEIHISARQEEAQITYTVKDNGVGFDMRYAEKLFGVFQRLHRAEDFEGTGVGLAIVQRIIHRHGGRIWSESKPGQGATFHFTLPG